MNANNEALDRAIGALVGLAVGDAVGTTLEWPGVGDLLRAYTSEWRYSALGAHAPAPPVFVLAAVLRIVTLGAEGMGRTLVVVGAIPLGMFGAYRLARAIAGRGWPCLVGAVVYGAVPLPRNAIQLGHVGALVLYAIAPLIALAVLSLAGLVDLVKDGDIPRDSHVLYAHLGGQPAINAYHSLWPAQGWG